MLQTRNHLLQHAPIPVDARLDFETHVSAGRAVEKGAEIDLRTAVRVGGSLAWESLVTFLARGRFDGFAFLWRATFRRPGGSQIVEGDGMDLAILRGGRLARNEVYFDRAVLAPLMAVDVNRPPTSPRAR